MTRRRRSTGGAELRPLESEPTATMESDRMTKRLRVGSDDDNIQRTAASAARSSKVLMCSGRCHGDEMIVYHGLRNTASEAGSKRHEPFTN